MIGVELGNSTETYRHGDEVQAVEAWIPSEILQDVSNEQADAIIAEIDKRISDGDRYSNAPSAKRRAASQVVIRHVKGKTEKRARDIIDAWIKGERLVSQEYMSPVSRKAEQGLFKGGKQEEIPF